MSLSFLLEKQMVNWRKVEIFQQMQGVAIAPPAVYLHIVENKPPIEKDGFTYKYKVVCSDPNMMDEVYCRDTREANELAVTLSKQSGIKVRREGYHQLKQAHELF